MCELVGGLFGALFRDLNTALKHSCVILKTVNELSCSDARHSGALVCTATSERPLGKNRLCSADDVHRLTEQSDLATARNKPAEKQLVIIGDSVF